MKHVKTLGVLLLVLVSIPFYFRNKGAVDHQMDVAWNAAKSYWSSESQETRNLKKAFSTNPVNMGKSGKSAGELRDEIIRKSEERIDAQEAKDVGPAPAKN